MGDIGSAVSSGMSDLGSSMSNAMSSMGGMFGGDASGMGGFGNAMSSLFGGQGGSGAGATQPFSDPNTTQAMSMQTPATPANQDPTGTAGGTQANQQTGSTPQSQQQTPDQARAAARAKLIEQLKSSIAKSQPQNQGKAYQPGGSGGAQGEQGARGGASPEMPGDTPLPNPLGGSPIDTSGAPGTGPAGLGLAPGTPGPTGPETPDVSPTEAQAGMPRLNPPGSGFQGASPWTDIPAGLAGLSRRALGGPIGAAAQQALQSTPAETGELPPGGFSLPAGQGGIGSDYAASQRGPAGSTQQPGPTPSAAPDPVTGQYSYDPNTGQLIDPQTGTPIGGPAGQVQPAAPSSATGGQPARPVTPTPGARTALGAGPGNEEESPTGLPHDPATGKDLPARTPLTKDQYEDWLKQQGVKPADAKKQGDASNLPTKKDGNDPALRRVPPGGGAPQGGYGAGGMNAGNLFRDIMGLATGGGGMMLPMLAMMAMGGMGGGGRHGRHGFGGFRGGRGGMRGGGRGYGRMPGFRGGHLPPGHYPNRGGGFGYHPGGFHAGWEPHDNWPGGGGGGGGDPAAMLQQALAYGGDQGQQGGFDQNGQPMRGGRFNRQGQMVGSGWRGNVGQPQQGPWSSNPFLSTLVSAESGGNNSAVGDNGLAKGVFQFHDATWQQAARNVPGASQWASAAQAPAEVQQQVAMTWPINQWGARTRAILHQKFGAFDERMTIGQLSQMYGGNQGGGGATAAAPAAAPANNNTPPVQRDFQGAPLVASQ